MTLTSDERESVRFSTNVTPGSEVELRKTIENGATVEEVRVRIYPGPELQLHVKPFIDRAKDPDTTRREPLLDYRGKEYVDGDDDIFTFDVSRQVENGQDIGILVENLDSSNTYDFSTDMTLEYAGGLSRVLGGVL